MQNSSPVDISLIESLMDSVNESASAFETQRLSFNEEVSKMFFGKTLYFKARKPSTLKKYAEICGVNLRLEHGTRYDVSIGKLEIYLSVCYRNADGSLQKKMHTVPFSHVIGIYDSAPAV